MPNRLIISLAFLLLMPASFAGGYFVRQQLESSSDNGLTDKSDRYERDLLQNFEFVQDALARWAKKNGMPEAQILEVWTPQAMGLDDRVCVQFVRRRPAIGGAPPVYCYGLDDSDQPTTQLIYEAAELGE
jgi:hypothetical protein